jgi:hypothetical protein
MFCPQLMHFLSVCAVFSLRSIMLQDPDPRVGVNLQEAVCDVSLTTIQVPHPWCAVLNFWMAWVLSLIALLC